MLLIWQATMLLTRDVFNAYFSTPVRVSISEEQVQPFRWVHESLKVFKLRTVHLKKSVYFREH